MKNKQKMSKAKPREKTLFAMTRGKSDISKLS